MAIALLAVVLLPVPMATDPLPMALVLLPTATPPAPTAPAPAPIAVDAVPPAMLAPPTASASLPVAEALSPWSPALYATYLLAPVAFSNWPRLTASVAFVPSATPVSLRLSTLPPVPRPAKLTVVPALSLATVMSAELLACCTKPIVPALIWAVRFVMAVALVVERPSSASIAPPTLSKSAPLTAYLGALIEPSAFTPAPPPSAVATELLTS